jgi:membrane-associated phospholipid phosphatase
METIWNIGITWNIFFQSLGGWLKTPMDFFSSLGTFYFFILLLPAFYWCVEASTGLRIGVILLLSLSVNDAFKMAFHGPRPYWYSKEVIEYASETSFGVPSGHSQNSAAIWGMLAFCIHKWWAWLIALLIVLFIGISRLYLGVHFPHDVLLGWIVGGLLLWMTLHFWKPITDWAKNLSLKQQILAAFLASLVILLIPVIPFTWLKVTGWHPPSSWASYADQAISLEGALTSSGALFGLLAGLAWFNHQGGFSADGPIWKRLLRFVLGAAVILILRFGLDYLFGLVAPDTEAALPYFLRYLRYTLIGVWVSAGAPWVFIKLTLAGKAS